MQDFRPEGFRTGNAAPPRNRGAVLLLSSCALLLVGLCLLDSSPETEKQSTEISTVEALPVDVPIVEEGVTDSQPERVAVDPKPAPAQEISWTPERILAEQNVDTLIELLKHDDAEFRIHAAVALGQRASKLPPLKSRIAAAVPPPEMGKVIDALKAALRDEHKMVRFHAVEAIGRIGKKAVTETMAMLVDSVRNDPEWIVARKAGIVVSLHETGGRSVQEWLALREPGKPLPPPAPSQRIRSVVPSLSQRLSKELQLEVPLSSENINALMKVVHEGSSLNRRAALQILLSHADLKWLTSHFIPLLFADRSAIRESVKATLWGESQDADLTARLAEAIRLDRSVRSITELVDKIGPEDRLSQALIPRLYFHRNQQVRLAVIRAISRRRLRLFDLETQEFLTRYWGETDVLIRTAAHDTIVELELPLIIAKRLVNRNWNNADKMDMKTVIALGQAGLVLTRSETLFQSARKLLQQKFDRETNPKMRQELIRSLGLISPSTKPTIAFFTDLLVNDESPEIRALAAENLGKIGPRAVSSLPQLVFALDQEGDLELFMAITAAVNKIVPDNQAIQESIQRLEKEKIVQQVDMQLQAIIEEEQRLLKLTNQTRKKYLINKLREKGLGD